MIAVVAVVALVATMLNCGGIVEIEAVNCIMLAINTVNWLAIIATVEPTAVRLALIMVNCAAII